MNEKELISFVTAPSLFLPKGGPKLLLVSPNKQWCEYINDLILDMQVDFPVTVYYVDEKVDDHLTWILYHTNIVDNILVYVNTLDPVYISIASALASNPKAYILSNVEDANVEAILNYFSHNPISNDSFAQLQSIFNAWRNSY